MSITGIQEQNVEKCLYAGITSQGAFTDYSFDCKGSLFLGSFGTNALTPTSVVWNGNRLVINENGSPAQ